MYKSRPCVRVWFRRNACVKRFSSYWSTPIEVSFCRIIMIIRYFLQIFLSIQQITRLEILCQCSFWVWARLMGEDIIPDKYFTVCPMVYAYCPFFSWWRHQIETFFALLALCARNSPVTGEYPSQGPVTQSFDVFFDLRLHKRLSKQSWGWWFEYFFGICRTILGSKNRPYVC